MLRTLHTVLKGGLAKNGVIGVNERNLTLINAHNPRALMHRVNDKVETKVLADAADIPNPALYGVVRNGRDLSKLEEMMAAGGDMGCVIKPAKGSQGKGVLVVDGPLMGGWRLANGQRVDAAAVRYHVTNILSGMYSLGGQPDAAMIEYRVRFDPVLERICFKGVPDVRVIVLSGVPAAAMVRLPTAASDGKANLHRGGVGVGVRINDGVTTSAMQGDRLIDRHPDTGEALGDIAIPHWDAILDMAARAYDVTGLGYVGVDIVLDGDRGPMLLELNGRPGLAIQIANRKGFREHLAAITALKIEKRDVATRVRFAKRLYETSFGVVSSDDEAAAGAVVTQLPNKTPAAAEAA
ncbi:MAG: alpha-L-glutamate ligase-like protein [Pseudomonadota bacterium]